jgi:hypothetical protein
VSNQSGAANQPDGDQGDAEVADDDVLSAGKILSRTSKKDIDARTSALPLYGYGARASFSPSRQS